MGSWLECHEFEPSITEDLSCSGAMHVKSVESSNVVWTASAGRKGCWSGHLTISHTGPIGDRYGNLTKTINTLQSPLRYNSGVRTSVILSKKSPLNAVHE
ncbi:hypothetical protein TNCV_4984831 [Trichonephila clavipes]|nr:hypothetical protein TNCV_4984831 [Trichonephila clavipes]